MTELAKIETQVNVRIANIHDLDKVMELCLAAVEDNGFLEATPQKLLQSIYPALTQEGGIIGVIEEPDGVLSGGILLTVGSHWYSDATFLEEKSVFISKDFRAAKGGRAARLVEFAKKAADTLALPLLIGVLSSTRTEGKIRMYRRIFGEPQGAFFLYGAKTGANSGAITLEGVGG